MDYSIFNDMRAEVTKNQINYMIVDLYSQQVQRLSKYEDKLYEIESLDQYSRTNKLQMGKRKIQEITKQLELQLTAKLAHLQRMKNKEQFAQFTFNPFNFAQQRPQLKNRLQTKTKRRYVDIIEGVEQTKKRCNMAKIKERLVKVEHQMNKIHTCMLNNRSKKKNFSFEVAIKPTENQMKKTINNKEFQFLDGLVGWKQEKKLTLKAAGKSVNIFKLRPKRQDKCMLNCRQILNSLFFCHNSIMHNPQNKQGGKCLKQMSLISRQFINNQHHLIDDDYRLFSSDMIIKLDEIFFEEIMLVSTGVLEPSQLHQNLNSIRIKSDKKDDAISIYYKENEDEIFYDQNLEHKSTIVKYEIPDHLLRQKLMSYPLTTKEQQQLQFSAEVQKQLEELLQREETLKRFRINDQELNRQIQKQRYDIMTVQIQKNADKEKEKLEKDIDKKIRLSKLYKDRSEGIKTRFLQESVTGVKKHDKKIQSISSKKQKRQTSATSKRQVPILPYKNKNGQIIVGKEEKIDLRHQYETQRLFSPLSKQKSRQKGPASKRKSLFPFKSKINPNRSLQ